VGILASPSFVGLDALAWFFLLLTAAIAVMAACLTLAIVSLLRARPFHPSVIFGNAVLSAAATGTMIRLLMVGRRLWLAAAIGTGTTAFVVAMVFLTRAGLRRNRAAHQAR
jgi:uncharacterized membrane protein YgaE (UPF0421/DUF939 family)